MELLSVAPSLKDLFYTPYSNNLLPSPKQNSGVEIQAHLTSIILSAALEGRPLLQTWSESVEVLWIFFWSSAGTALTWAVRFQGYKNYSLLRTVMGLVIVAIALISMAYLLFLSHWWIPVVPPVIA